jgi:hypothetical protein
MKNLKMAVNALDSGAEFAPALDEAAVADAEQQLRIAFPADLRNVFFATDGLIADYGSEIIWSLSDIVNRNSEFRESEEFRDLYMPFDHLLFFGDDGGGDQFALAIHADGIIHKDDVYRWEHETDARSWFASGITQYLEKRLSRADRIPPKAVK